MLSEVLTGGLTTRQRAFGLYLEDDGDYLYLKLKGEVKAEWVSFTATVIGIQKVANSILEGRNENISNNT